MTKLYIASENYFVNDLFEVFNNNVNNFFSERFSYHKSKLKRLVTIEQRQNYCEQMASKLLDSCNSNIFEDHFEYKLDLEENKCLIFQSTLINMLEMNECPDPPANPSEFQYERITIWEEKLFFTIYVDEGFEKHYIDDSDVFINKFIEIKGEYLFEQTSNYIEYLLLINLKDNYQFINNIIDTKIKLEASEIDLRDTAATEKIVMLHKLGVLEYLRTKEPFNTSINALANVLSGITGEKSTTLQSYLNPIYSGQVDQKNNPLRSEKTVQKVNQKLISVGFNAIK